jgi:hypothetical protein
LPEIITQLPVLLDVSQPVDPAVVQCNNDIGVILDQEEPQEAQEAQEMLRRPCLLCFLWFLPYLKFVGLDGRA